MTVYATERSRTNHLYRECLPMRSHYSVYSTEVESIEPEQVCKRCLARRLREGWPATT